jgi:hypothetical protein
MLATAVSLAVLAGLGLGWAADRLVRHGSSRSFEREFAALVADTPIDWDDLHGPGPGGEAAAARSGTTAAACAEALAARAKPLGSDDLEYYATSWRNIRGQFERYPASALRLARHLTANLLINRGLVPRDTLRPSRLPEAWVFPSARGYRDAEAIAERAESAGTAAATGGGTAAELGGGQQPSAEELARALSLFEDFYWEILALAPAVS